MIEVEYAAKGKDYQWTRDEVEKAIHRIIDRPKNKAVATELEV